MELRHLRYFLAVAEDLSFTQAALRLGIAQPALSQQIQNLEREIGFTLFRRLPRGVALTEGGQCFQADARTILNDVELAVTKGRRTARGEMGLIRIGFTGSASFNPFVTGAIRDYRNAFPDVEVELVEENTSSLLARFKAGRIDAAFIRPIPGEVKHLWAQPLFSEAMVVALPSGHPLAELEQVPLATLSGEAFILYPRTNGRALYDSIVSACEKAGFTPKISQSAPQMTSTVNLVATGIGISIVPASMAQVSTEGATYRPIEGHAPKADMTLVRGQNQEQRSAVVFTELVLARLPK